MVMLGTERVGKMVHNVKRLGFCGVYTQRTFHAIEPNRCYTKFLFFGGGKYTNLKFIKIKYYEKNI